jgi:hypothetical protein
LCWWIAGEFPRISPFLTLMTPADRPSVPSPAGGTAGVTAEFSQRHAGYLPTPPEELNKRLDVAPESDEATWREAYAQRRALYAQRAGPDQPKPVRFKNLALLKQFEELQPALEAHLQAYHVWRLLGEASDYLHGRQVGRCRNRLKEAAGLLEQQPPGKLRQWYDDLEADIADEGAGAAPATKPEAPVVAPPRPPPMVVAPAETTAIEGGVVACAVAVWPKEATVEVGGLPAGLKFDAARGQIMGIPASAGDFNITVTASDASGQASAHILLRVAPRELRPPRLVHPATVAARTGVAFDWVPVLENGPARFLFEDLPPGLAGDPASGRIQGVPEQAGTVAITVIATNADGFARNRLRLEIAETPAPPVMSPQKVAAPASGSAISSGTPEPAPAIVAPPAPVPAVSGGAIPPATVKTPSAPVGSNLSTAPFSTLSRHTGKSGVASRPLSGVLLKLIPSPLKGSGQPPGPPIHLVARPRFVLGRRLESVDFAACFFPDNPENRQKTMVISRVNTTLFLKGNQILVQDGELVEESKFKASMNGTVIDGKTITTAVPIDFTKERRLWLGQSGYEMTVVQLPAVAPGGPLIPPTATLSTHPTMVLSQRPLGCLRFRPVACREVRVAAVWMFSEAAIGTDAQSAVVLDAPGVPPLAVRFHHWKDGFWLEVPLEGKSVVILDGRQRAAGDVVPLQALHQLGLGPLNYELHVS